MQLPIIAPISKTIYPNCTIIMSSSLEKNTKAGAIRNLSPALKQTKHKTTKNCVKMHLHTYHLKAITN